MGRRVDVESYVYILHDPTEVSQRVYVGWTGQNRRKTHPGPTKMIEWRRRRHVIETEQGVDRVVNRWIRRLAARGIEPAALMLEAIRPGEDWEAAETFWIAYFRSIGAEMANISDGGDGSAGWRMTTEGYARHQAMVRGKLTKSRSGYKGVVRNPRSGLFDAGIMIARRRHYIGGYETAVEAAAAYDIVARATWGLAASLNFPLPGEKAARGSAEELGPIPAVEVRWPGDLRRTRTPRRLRAIVGARRGVEARGVVGLKGVSGSGDGRPRFRAKLAQRHLGWFGTPEEAAQAYDAAARAAWGKDAALNFPGPGEKSARKPK